MRNSKKTKRALLSSVMALLLCFTMLLGTTFAWFTDSVSSANNVIKSGNLDVNLYYWDNSMETGTSVAIEEEPDLKLLRNVDGGEILWEPGATGFGQFEVANEGSLALKYQLNLNFYDATETPEGKTLADVLSVYAIARNCKTGDDAVMEDANLELLKNTYIDSYVPGYESQSLTDFVLEGYLLPGESFKYEIGAFWEPSDKDNEYNVDNGLSINFGVTLLATQMTYEKDAYDNQYDKDATYPEIADRWDGTADISWYNDTDTEFTLNSAEQLAGLAELVDGGNTFEGKTVNLGTSVDLYSKDENGEMISFNPIGYGYDVVFKGTFDGQNNSISNLYQNGWALGLDYSTEGGGLFASVVDATIKNVNIVNAEVVMECIDMGVLVGYSYGNCTYENILVSDSTIANYQRYTGGVVGEVNGTQTFTNVDVKDTIVSSLWGDFDCSLGGIVGGKWGDATLTFVDCDVECELNAYNDVTSSYQWYAYRRAGMLIGNSEETATENGRTSATATYLTCENCTVTYGDWANYTYCEFAGTSWPYVRVQAGYSCSAYSNPRYGVATDANGNKAVDDTHVHNDGEDHNIPLTFDQLLGGGQGVYGTATHDGVTVIYNNK